MSAMQSAFDPRSRFVILWTLAESWYAAALTLATPWLVGSGNFLALQVLAFLSVPVAAASQIPLLRPHLRRPWLWLAAGVAAAILLHLLLNVVLLGVIGAHLPAPGQGLSAWLPYFLLSSALVGLALGLPQAVVMARWKLGGGGWFLVVLGAAIVAGAIGGVVWVMTGAADAGTDRPLLSLLGALARQVAFGVITGAYLWQRLQQRSVDAAPPVP